MTTIQLINGHPFATVDFLAEEWGKSKQTIKIRLREIEKMDRYPKKSVKRFKGNLQGCDYLVFYDYMTHHDVLVEKNLEDPSYNPHEIANNLGWYRAM